MNSQSPPKILVAIYFVGILGAFLIVAWLVWMTRSYVTPPAIDAARAEERRKALSEVTATAKDQVENYGYVDPTKGQVRLPIQRAMEMAVQEWQNPAAARSNLLARVAKFNPPPPPQAPPKPNPFE